MIPRSQADASYGFGATARDHGALWYNGRTDAGFSLADGIAMNIPYRLLPDAWLWIAAGIYALMLLWCVWRADWARLKQSEQLHVYLGSCVTLLVLWTIRTPILPGFEYHYLGATLLTLMFGVPLAGVGMSLVLLGTVLNGAADWQSYPFNALVMGFVPIAVSHAVRRAAERWLPPNFFVYVFVCGYFGGAMALLCMGLASAALLWFGDVYSLQQLADIYFPLVPLLVVPEAFITGILIALMVVFRPEWVASFDDKRYLKGK